MKILVVAEKPSAGRDIARVLGCGQKGEGYLYSETHTVTWAIGHLAELYEPEDYNAAYKKWTLDSLPVMPDEMKIKASIKTRKQFNLIKKLMNSADTESIVCATDSGREGELIFRYVYKLAGCKKKFARLWITSMTDAAIREGFLKLKDGSAYDSLYVSARCRAEADWLVGINATRAYTVKHGELLSAGRVQTPTLALIVMRQREIDSFVSEEYWEVKADFIFEGGGYSGLRFEGEMKTRIDGEKKAKAMADAVKGKKGTVEKVTTDEKRVPPPLLFDLTELQRECNRRFGFSAKKTLSTAQSLYEKYKLATYPRTDSRYLSGDWEPKLPQIINSLDGGQFAEAVKYINGLEKLPVTKRLVDDSKVTEHHAIIPTGKKPPAELPKDEQAVFEIIARRFLAAFYPQQIIDETTAVTIVETGEETHRFVSKGKSVKQEGWAALYKDDVKEDAVALPPLAVGQAVCVGNAAAVKKKTQPPKAYTEATLLSAMENAGRFAEDEAIKEQMKDAGIGTPATRASIIERLIAVGYVTRKTKSLVPTEKGARLIDIVPKELKTPETTGKWERGLSRIARGDGSMDEQRFMESIKRYVRFLVDEAQKVN
ncbi:MAG: DNA topoisomerase 3 [Defluviitaleaceae bacterium]|nr:DNA topoisomerase 3 [Defluviitaleaceae bacterium]